jgi:hypothetical protein
MSFIRQVPRMFQFWEHQVIQDVVDTGWVDRINPVSGFEGRTSGILRFVCPGNERDQWETGDDLLRLGGIKSRYRQSRRSRLGAPVPRGRMFEE